MTKIIDGDTFETGSCKNPIRLADIDATEKGKPGYAKATETLQKMIKEEELKIYKVCHDKYGRAVANVYKSRESVNKKMQKKLKQ